MNRLDLSDAACLPAEVHQQMSRTKVSIGDVLLNITGASIGRVACVQQLDRQANVSQHVCLIRPKLNSMHGPYLAYFISQPTTQKQILNVQAGASRQALNHQQVRAIEVPTPPLDEQRRIVAILDQAENLRTLRQQADHRTADLIPALFHEMFGDPATNHKGWPMVPLGEMAENQDGRRRPVKESDRAGRHGPYPYYGASGIIDYFDSFIFDQRTLLVGEDGANLLARSTPIAFTADGKYWVNNHAHVLSDNGRADLDYICVALNLRDISDYVTGSAQPKLNQANLNRIPLPLPPLPLQKQFAAAVADIRDLQQKQAASKERLDDLFHSLLHRAFRGEL